MAEANFPMLLHQTTLAWRSLVNKRLKPLGLSQARWRALLYLSKAEQPLTQCELATLLEIEPPSVVGLIDRLAKEGWVERVIGADRRMKYLHLTEQAHDTLLTIQNAADAVRHELLEGISTADLEICMKVLKSVKNKAEHCDG